MSSLDGFDRLLAEFGESIGIPQMAFDEDGLCHIRVDEEYPITFRRDDEHHNLVLVGLIAEELPEQLEPALVRDMLATGVEPLRDNGAALGLEPISGTLILHQTLPLAKIDRPMLEQALGAFILMQKEWSARVAGRAPVMAPEAEAAGAMPRPPVGDAPMRPPRTMPAPSRPQPGPQPGPRSGAQSAAQAGPQAAGQPPAHPSAKAPPAEPRVHPHLHHR